MLGVLKTQNFRCLVGMAICPHMSVALAGGDASRYSTEQTQSEYWDTHHACHDRYELQEGASIAGHQILYSCVSMYPHAFSDTSKPTYPAMKSSSTQYIQICS